MASLSSLDPSDYCAVLTSGSVDCWGNGQQGQLGNGVFYSSTGTGGSAIPVQVLSSPTTSVVIPSNNATVSGTQLLDAFASSGVTQVQYELTGGTYSDTVIATANRTYYGWLAN